jgi:hypothetical protein
MPRRATGGVAAVRRWRTEHALTELRTHDLPDPCADGSGGIVTAWERVDGAWLASWSRDVATDLASWQANRARGQRMRSR